MMKKERGNRGKKIRVEGVREKRQDGIELQKRDKKILRLAYEHQFILTEHIEKYFGCYRVACRRGMLLSHSGLLYSAENILGRKVIYRTTREGSEIALQDGAIHIRQTKYLSPSTLLHDAMVLSVRQRLEDLWDAEFICERSFKQSDRKEIPDGIFKFKSGNQIVIEVENSDKGRTRFLKLLERRFSGAETAFTLYIATSHRLFEIIQDYLKEGPKDRPMGLVHSDDLLNSKPLVWTLRGELPLLDRREF